MCAGALVGHRLDPMGSTITLNFTYWNSLIGASMKILVRNLSRETTEDALLELFKPFGNVQYCKVVMDKLTGKSKGFAFVEIPHAGDAKLAIKTLNGRELDGSKIRVKKAEADEAKSGD